MLSQNDIIEMARQAGFNSPNPHDGYMGLAYDRREEGETGSSLEAFAKLVAAKAFPDGVDAEWIARRTKYAVEQERANNALLCYQQRKHWDALACSDAIRAGTRARGEA